MYAEQSGFDALQLMAERLAAAHVRLANEGLTTDLADTVAAICYDAASALAVEFRRELGVKLVQPKDGVTRTVDYPPSAA